MFKLSSNWNFERYLRQIVIFNKDVAKFFFILFIIIIYNTKSV